MRPFHLVREVDVSGVSGTGIVAEGVEFTDGRVALRWLTATPSTALWDSIDQARAVHGHGGHTTVRWANVAILPVGDQRARQSAAVPIPLWPMPPLTLE
jgi:hypothetical protein